MNPRNNRKIKPTGLGLANDDLVNYLMRQKGDIGGEVGESVAAVAAAAPANTVASIASTGKLERAHMLKNPKWTTKRFMRKAGPLGIAASTALDTYQGRDNAYKIFGPNANMGQRAASVASGIANGATFGLFNFNSPESIKKLYKYYGGK